MENENVNYSNEAKNLKERGNWFNPGAGKYTIEPTSEMVEREAIYEGEKSIQGVLDIKVGKDELKWSMNKGETSQSLYGQLILVGANVEPKGVLVGKTITLLVKSVTDKNGNKKREFTVEEALPFMEQKEADK